ncbi:ribonuclease H-like domain-containing protein [Tanacetum coccineum]|uniref:Ribonuclease H-like domain-containing protein n=1 Tax=Tanacetum coccineum TaxID=301880 RepID=A0ABQ5GQ70_9ASTR
MIYSRLLKDVFNIDKADPKECEVYLGKSQDEAFRLLKKRLTESPILVLPKGSDMVVYSDASNLGLGWVGSEVAYLLIYVDDIILTASSITLLQQIISSLHSEFDMTDLGALNYFLVDTESKLGPKGVPVQDPTLYRILTGLWILAYTYIPPPLHRLLVIRMLIGQNTLSRSSAEAEYRGVANIVAKTAWIRNLLRKLHFPLSSATLVYCDNVSVIYLSANPVQHQRTKHIEINIHFVCDMVTTSQVRVLHVPSRYQFADIFTKGLPFALFEEF